MGDFYSAPDMEAEFCDYRVCAFVCLSVQDHSFGTTRPILTVILSHV